MTLMIIRSPDTKCCIKNNAESTELHLPALYADVFTEDVHSFCNLSLKSQELLLCTK